MSALSWSRFQSKLLQNKYLLTLRHYLITCTATANEPGRVTPARDLASALSCVHASGVLQGRLRWLTRTMSGGLRSRCPAWLLSLIHISEPTRLGMISYAVF